MCSARSATPSSGCGGKNSVEYKKKKELQEALRLERVGSLWLNWAIVAVVFVVILFIVLIVMTQMGQTVQPR